MAINLNKGSKVSLSKEIVNLGIPKLNNVAIGLGWDVSKTYNSMDLDAWALAFDGERAKRENLIYFGNRHDNYNAIYHHGDNLTGDGDGDDEVISINLDNIPLKISLVLVGVTIYSAKTRHQSFNDVENAFIRVYDKSTNIEICKYSDRFKDSGITKSVTMLFGAFVRTNNEWEFIALGKESSLESVSNALSLYSLTAINNILPNNNNFTNGGKQTMAVSLKKGGKVSLAKVAEDAGISGGLTKVIVGLGWDTNRYDGGAQFDLDASAFMVGENGKVLDETGFIFYGNKVGAGIEHTGDNRTGEGDGDDEQIKVDLSAIPANISKVAFTVTIDQADVRAQNFGMVENSYIRVIDEATGTELIKYDLGEDFSVETAIVVAEIYRHNGEWKFNAVGSGFSGGLAALCGNYGIDVE